MNEDNRQRIVSRRVLTPKGETDGGGGGGEDAGVSRCAKTFACSRSGSARSPPTRAGHATTDVKLPESLTTYRIMAVAGDKASRFGSGESEIRINKPVVLKAAFPRFLTRGDKAYFGIGRHEPAQERRARRPSRCEASIRTSADSPATTRRRRAGRRRAAPPKCASTSSATAVGRARIQMTVRLGGESDAFEDSSRCESLVSPETRRRLRRSGAATRRQPLDVADRHRARRRRAARRAVVDGARRPRRRRALRRRVSVRLRRAARVARLRARVGGRSRRRVQAAGHRRRRIARATRRRRCSELEAIQCSIGRVRVLAGRVLDRVAVSDQLRAARLPDAPQSLKYDVEPGRDEARVRLPAARARGGAAGERGLVAGVHRVASVCREGARRRRPQPGLPTSTGCTATAIGCRCSRSSYLLDAMLAKGETGPRARPSCAAASTTRSCPRPAARTSRS